MAFSVMFYPVFCPRSRLLAEARGDFSTAVASYRLALRLLLVRRDGDASVQQPSSTEGRSTSLQTGGWCEEGRQQCMTGVHACCARGLPALHPSAAVAMQYF